MTRSQKELTDGMPWKFLRTNNSNGRKAPLTFTTLLSSKLSNPNLVPLETSRVLIVYSTLETPSLPTIFPLPEISPKTHLLPDS